MNNSSFSAGLGLFQAVDQGRSFAGVEAKN